MKIIIINGPMGVGKTSVGKCIAETYPGTAFMDGDWCLDLHPFVGNDETKSMAVDNILHMIANYKRCSVCRMIVLTWLMDEGWVRQRIADGAADLGLEIRSVTLLCGQDELVRRWNHDRVCEWRTNAWLEESLKSLPVFAELENGIDTTGLSIEQVAELVIHGSCRLS